MALEERHSFTVRGADHFFSKFAKFTCTAVPLLDADNQTIGVLNLSAIDRGNTTDYLFARQLLESGADRIQRHLFEHRYQQARIISVSMPDYRYLFRSNEMIAVDEDGIILGATAKAHNLVGMAEPTDLTGKSFELLFGAEAGILRIPQRIDSVNATDGTALNLQMHVQNGKPYHRNRNKGRKSQEQQLENKTCRSRRLTPSLKDLAVGGEVIATLCARANEYFHRALPFVIEGASGTGKSALVASLLEGVVLSANQVLTIDCATLGESENDRRYFRTLIEQARAIDSLTGDSERLSAMVFENIDELPMHAQAELRKLLSDIELSGQAPERSLFSDLRIIATCRKSLIQKMEKNQFRDDLYYLLTSAVICLPTIIQKTSKIVYDERTMLVDALKGARWNVSQAARTLAIGRATIHRKMKRHGITRPDSPSKSP